MATEYHFHTPNRLQASCELGTLRAHELPIDKEPPLAKRKGRTPSINEERERTASTPASRVVAKAVKPKKGVAAKKDRELTTERNRRVKRGTGAKESEREHSEARKDSDLYVEE